MWYWAKILFLVLLGAIFVWLGYEYLTFPNTSKLAKENPQTTSMVEARITEAKREGREPRRYQIWVSIDQISPNLQRAVLAGEDVNFFSHDGFDWEAINAVWEGARKETEREAKSENDNDAENYIPPLDRQGFLEYIWENFGVPSPDKFNRGASTITQQLAKNLYLSEERSLLRKGREATITYFLERDLQKRRILEIYLNVIEWGDGIYGAEAASRYYFKKSASALTAQEAAYLSAMIPSPLNVFNPSKNPKRVARRQRVILRGMPFVKLP